MKLRLVFLFLILLLGFSLRIFRLGENPPSLYWDEASLGFNAYTIATSFRDEHGEFLPLNRFIAFGDYKPPGYIYATVPSVILFGLNELSVRLPSMLAGFLMILVTFFLVKELFKNEIVALLSSFFLAVSPWAVHFSRAAFEANLAALFNLLGIYFFVSSVRKKWFILLSFIFFIFSFYTFNANRIIAPLLLAGLSIIFRNSLIQNKKWILISLIVSLVLIYPSINYLLDRESRLRFQEVSIFNNLETVKLSNNRILQDDNSWWASIIHNRRVLFTIDFLKHYFDNFSGRFLFTHGDVNPRLSIQEIGELYVWDLPFFIIGIYWLIKKRVKALPVLILWMLIVPIPAATARETPHALRILSILPTYQIIIAYGMYQFLLVIKRKVKTPPRYTPGLLGGEGFITNSSTIGGAQVKLGHPRGVFTAYWYPNVLFFVLCSLFFVNIYYYLHNYYIHYPLNWSSEWQYGYKQMVEYVSGIQKNYDTIFITNALGRPYIYFAFYQQYPLDYFLKVRKAERDWFGFWYVTSLGKIKFGLDGLSAASGRILLVTTAGNLPDEYHLVDKIKDLSGREIFLIAERR